MVMNPKQILKEKIKSCIKPHYQGSRYPTVILYETRLYEYVDETFEEWLKQKQIKQTKKITYMSSYEKIIKYGYQKAIKELLEELKK